MRSCQPMPHETLQGPQGCICQAQLLLLKQLLLLFGAASVQSLSPRGPLQVTLRASRPVPQSLEHSSQRPSCHVHELVL